MRVRAAWPSFVRTAGLATIALVASQACKNGEAPPSRICPPDCDQPKIPPGVPGFQIVKDDVSGPSDGQTVILRGVLRQKTKRDAVYPALHFLYRYAMTRNTFEPTSFVGELYATESDANAGSNVVAKIWKERTDKGPKCENTIKLEFGEEIEQAFLHSLNRAQPENLDDTCHIQEKKQEARFDDGFAHKPSFTADAARQTAEVHFPYLETGKDQYARSVTFNEAMTYWTEFTSTMFQKAGDLKAMTYEGVLDDQPIVKITVTRPEYDSKLSTVQETVASHAAITFAKLGLHKTNDKGALKEQEQSKTTIYKAALSFLPKDQVFVSPRLK